MGVQIKIEFNIERDDLESILEIVGFHDLGPKVDIGTNLKSFIEKNGDLPPNLKEMMNKGMTDFLDKIKKGDEEDLK
jgi:hypothetical protein